MDFSFDDDRGVTIAIRKVTNGYVLKMYRPAKPYQNHEQIEVHEMVFMGLEPCLEFARKFLQNPWETEVGR
ncbi:MAG: hypothetical protein AAB152_10645 [Candidatus Coatesbacteria bacterium]